MINNKYNSQYKYIPILSLSPSEMGALEQLPGKDKDMILPVFPLKGWAISKKLVNSIERIKKSIGSRNWVAHIDKSFLSDNKTFLFTGKYPRDVFYEIQNLLKPDNGYLNWYHFIQKIPNAIPCLQLDEISELRLQISRFVELNRMVVIFDIKNMTRKDYDSVINILASEDVKDIHFLYDVGTLNNAYRDYIKPLSNLMEPISRTIVNSSLSISGTSFPSGFSGYHKGENPIYERLLFNNVNEKLKGVDLIYSDRGSARIEKQNGGGGIPSPRIDYPLKNDWRFVRNEYEDAVEPKEGEKEILYKRCAIEILEQAYWQPELFLWGTQMIELTAKGEKYSINSPQKATAVRINIHLYTQLHYNDDISEIDTDEDWVD